MVYETWINKAISKTGSLPPNTAFVLKDLFDGIAWNKITNGEKRELGRLFKHKVTSEMIPGVILDGKAANGSTRYKIQNR